MVFCVVMLVVEVIGKILIFMCVILDYVVIYMGDEIVFGEVDGYFFVFYVDNIVICLCNNDLEEMVFYEFVYVMLDVVYLCNCDWCVV